MARRRRGSIDDIGGGAFRMRFRLEGQRHSITLTDSTLEAAEAELDWIAEQIKRGVWEPPEKRARRLEAPTFGQFATAWYAEHSTTGGRNGGPLAGGASGKYAAALNLHLLPRWGDEPMQAITVAEVDDFRVAQLRSGLAASTVAGQLVLLGQILDAALERDLLASNPMRVNRRRRLPRIGKPKHRVLTDAAQIGAVLEAAGEQGVRQRALVAVLVLGGLRIGEACEARWQDLSLPASRLPHPPEQDRRGRPRRRGAPAPARRPRRLEGLEFLGRPGRLHLRDEQGRRARRAQPAPPHRREGRQARRRLVEAQELPPLASGIGPHDLPPACVSMHAWPLAGDVTARHGARRARDALRDAGRVRESPRTQRPRSAPTEETWWRARWAYSGPKRPTSTAEPGASPPPRKPLEVQANA